MPPNNQQNNQFSQFPPKFVPPSPQNPNINTGSASQSMPPKPPTPIEPPSPSPTTQTVSSVNSKEGLLKIIGLVLAILIVVVGIYLAIGQSKTEQGVGFTDENVLLTDNGGSVPQGLPKDLPIEKNNTTKSATLEYPDRGATLYSVNFVSQKQTEELFATYKKYLASANYTIMNQTKSPTLMNYRATSGNNELEIILTPQLPNTLVQINYVVRK